LKKGAVFRQEIKKEIIFWKSGKSFYLCSPAGNGWGNDTEDHAAYGSLDIAEARCGGRDSSLRK